MSPASRAQRADASIKYVDPRQVGSMVGLDPEEVARIASRWGVRWHRFHGSQTVDLDQILAAIEAERASAEEAA